FAHNIQIFAELENIFEAHIRKISKTLVFERHGDKYISIQKLKKLPEKKSILFSILRPYGFNHEQTDDILEHIDYPPGAVYCTDSARIIRDRRFLVLTKGKATSSSLHYIFEDTQYLTVESFTLHFKKLNELPTQLKTPPHKILVNGEKLRYPLILRRWKEGDYFYPFGMGGKKKKLKKFFTDIKLPLHEKEKVWVLESDKRIVWVVGYRADERFKLNKNANHILEISISTNENIPD
ncbi:MAG: tRNA lysidine(34) synthetase TilS, partial [Chitinophagales bacterium]|nr:tRNA lysidine(34) synthetase TilS [Chitinophagales bacterium]